MNNNIFHSTSSPVTIAIIGGGLSGSLVAANLLRHATTPLFIKLIERNSRWEEVLLTEHQWIVIC